MKFGVEVRSGAKFWFGVQFLVGGKSLLWEATYWVSGEILCQGKILDQRRNYGLGEKFWVGCEIFGWGRNFV